MRIGNETSLSRADFLERLQKIGEAPSAQNSQAFSDLLSHGVHNVNQMQLDSNEQVNQLLSGQDINSAEVMTGIQKADMSFRLLVQVRNKLMQAYDEINNIRV